MNHHTLSLPLPPSSLPPYGVHLISSPSLGLGGETAVSGGVHFTVQSAVLSQSAVPFSGQRSSLYSAVVLLDYYIGACQLPCFLFFFIFILLLYFLLCIGVLSFSSPLLGGRGRNFPPYWPLALRFSRAV